MNAFKIRGGRLYTDQLHFADSAEALEHMIAKWTLIVENDLHDGESTAECGLCSMHLAGRCQECPIYRHTGKRFCHKTPRRRFETAESSEDRKDSAFAFLTYLKTLHQKSGTAWCLVEVNTRRAVPRPIFREKKENSHEQQQHELVQPD